MQPTLMIRSTRPGRDMGLREWSIGELTELIASYKKEHPSQWKAYLEAEGDRGFLDNAKNDHIMSHIERAFPNLPAKHYRIGAVDFRFANERSYRFRMWQPENRQTRRDAYWADVSETQSRHHSVYSNGHVEWTGQQISEFLSYLERDVPDFWTELREVYDEIGFAEVSIVKRFRELAASRFAVPEDLDCSTISAGVVEEMDHLFQFRMMRFENRERMWRLQEDWMVAREKMTFEEWRQRIQHGR